MKRIDKIYNYIRKKSEQVNLKNLEENKEKLGFAASDIAQDLGILRNNVSMELNKLLRQDKIIKIKGRPVLYFHKEVLEKLLNKKLPKGPLEIETIEELKDKPQKKEEYKSPFNHIIGAEGSLKNQIEQAKAAILYPPNGLHTLIVGPTGVGKTLFANMMYNYAKFVGKLKEDSPFIVFNCADYYNNPQLLISQIFGHVKGAFTGAESEKSGLVEKANGGILFLDEIHRLPPEGQEMIFYFMDTGTFNKLGETERNRKSNVLIICATTEDPTSSLLKTFVRRIPIVINIPPLDERPTKEKIDLIKNLLSKEAHRVNKPIKVSEDVVKALIGSVSYGNIGQLKSNIQLICAKGFLNSIDNESCVDIDFKTLPSNIKDGLLLMAGRRKELEEISRYVDTKLVVVPEGNNIFIQQDTYEPPFNLYKIIEDKASILKDEGVDDEYIKKFITTDINIHLKSFYDRFKIDSNNRENFLKIIDEQILELSEEIKELAEKRLGRKYNERFIYAISLHISAFLKRLKEDTEIKYSNNIESIITENPEEYKVALEIKSIIENKYTIKVPDIEVIYLTLLLTSIQETAKAGTVGIVVAAHGSSTASSMVNVATKLLGEYNIKAVDMPLDVSPRETLDKVIEAVEQMDMGKGVLILVDMGSLANFETEIIERTGIEVKVLDMVSTAIVLEATRKSNFFNMELNSIYNSLKSFRGYGKYEEVIDREYDKVIVTICSTGEGTAIKLKQLVEGVIQNITDEYINVIPLSVYDLKEEVERIQSKYKIIASVGVIDPKINAPFIPLERLLDGSGEEEIKMIIGYKYEGKTQKDTKIITKELCEDSLKQFLTYLNPHKIISVLISYVSVLEKEMNTEFSNSMIIRLVIHTACALERMIINDGLVYRKDTSHIDKERIKKVKKAAKVFKESLNIDLTEDEVYYICDMFD
ncbi:MAG: sigma 54-interacting transcriptional regulator [Caloramator sp.]|nr:sigma 54-interacting transcriptional regulator [Caloramator sp.]